MLGTRGSLPLPVSPHLSFLKHQPNVKRFKSQCVRRLLAIFPLPVATESMPSLIVVLSRLKISVQSYAAVSSSSLSLLANVSTRIRCRHKCPPLLSTLQGPADGCQQVPVGGARPWRP